MDLATELQNSFLKEKREQVLSVQQKIRNAILCGETHKASELLIQLEQKLVVFEDHLSCSAWSKVGWMIRHLLKLEVFKFRSCSLSYALWSDETLKKW
ncbi:hypothetical protein ACFL53_03795 [Pseudomonadota bacterium]